MAKIETVEDLYYYFNLLETENIDANSVEIALDDFLENFIIETAYKDSLNRLNGHIDVNLANAIIKFQDLINTALKVVKYGDADVKLSNDGLSTVHLFVKVAEGSTLLDYFKASGKVFNDMTEGMTAKQKIVLAGLIVGIITVGVVANNIATKYFEAEEKAQLSAEETERQKNIIDGMSKMSEKFAEPTYKVLLKEGQKAILEPVKNNDGVTFNITAEESKGEEAKKTTINQQQAKEILKSTRDKATTDTLTQRFNIDGVLKSSEPGKVKVQISTIDGVLRGTVEFSKSNDQIDFVQILENFGAETPIKLVVGTKTIRDVTSITAILATLSQG